MAQKYIITKNKDIIVFSETIQHSDFRKWEPISAGFITFGVNEYGDVTCSCHGRSVSLGLDSRPEEDTFIARLQLNLDF